MILWQPVQSSNVRALRHDPGAGTLDVEFHSGNAYRYYDVSFATYQELLRAESVGRTLRRLILGTKQYVRLTPEESL